MTTDDDEIRLGFSAGGPTVEDGTYIAKLTQYGRTTGQFGPQVKFVFEVDDEENAYHGSELACWADMPKPEGSDATPLMKLYKILDALMGEDPLQYFERVGKPVAFRALVGRRCRIRVEEQPRRDGSVFSKVTGFTRLKKAIAVVPASAPTARAPRAARQAAPEEEPPWEYLPDEPSDLPFS